MSRFFGAVLALCWASSALGADPYAWTAPGPYTQVQDDDVVVEPGLGALFVPAIAAGDTEPRYFVVSGDSVTSARIGDKVPLVAGRYVVVVGSGGPEHSIGVPVAVEEGRVTLVPVEWGGLRVEVVNSRLDVTTTPYELIEVATGEVISTLPELWTGDEAPSTWLLAPGLYRVQQPTSDGSLRPDFTTVHVPAGGLAKLRVFVDRAGRFRGAGVVPTGDDSLTADERGPWDGSLVVGLSGSLTQSHNAVGRQNFALAEGSLWLDGHLDFLSPRHTLNLDVHAEEGALFLQPASGKALPWIKSQDELRGLLAYTFLLNEGAGIYARGGINAQILPTQAIATQDLTAVYTELDGTQRSLDVAAADTYSLNDDYFNPVNYKLGAGLRSRLSTHRDIDVSLYAGAGARFYRFGGAYLADDTDDTDTIELRAIDAFDLYGPELGATVGFRINGFASYSGSVDWFAPIDSLDQFIVESGHSVSLRFTKALSVSYRIDVARVPQITERVMLRQGLSVRLGWNIL